MVRPAIVAVSASARPLAERIAAALDGEIVDVRGGASETLRALFREGRPIVGLCAAARCVGDNADPVVAAHEVNVQTREGIVQLAGFVDNADEKSKAAEVTRRVAGVKQVDNQLEVKQR